MRRLPGLDLLRAVAIVWVMLFHSYIVGGLGADFAWLSRFGWAGVDIFFVLSGFLIGSQVLKPLRDGQGLSFGRFYARRAYRILPAFAVVLALYVAFPGLREAPGLQPWWQFATFTVNLLIDYADNPAFSHAWSLCVEEHFYLIFPVLAWWLTRRPSVERFARVCFGIVVAGIGLRTAIWLYDSTAHPLRNWYVEDLYFPTWTRLDGLLMGVMLATMRVYRLELWTRWQARANTILVSGLVVVSAGLWLFRDRTGFVGNTIGWPILSLGMAMLVFAAADRRSVIGRWRVPGAGWIAAVSYSLYLSHKIAHHLVQSQLGDLVEGRGIATFAVYAAAVLVLGALLHSLVERPFLRWRDRRTVSGHDADAMRITVTG